MDPTKIKGFENISDLLKMFQNPQATGKISPWWQTFSYPDVQNFTADNFINFPILSLFFRALMTNETVMDEEYIGDFKAPLDEYLDNLVRLNGKVIYSFSNESSGLKCYFVSFDTAAVYFSHFKSAQKVNGCYLRMVGTPDIFEKIKEISSGFFDTCKKDE